MGARVALADEPQTGLTLNPAHVQGRTAPITASCPRAALTRTSVIPRTPDARLYLRRAVPARMHRTTEDYRVFSRERPVGSIWLDPAPKSVADKIAPWHWSIDTTKGGTAPDGW
jgi:hypothetical protein